MRLVFLLFIFIFSSSFFTVLDIPREIMFNESKFSQLEKDPKEGYLLYKEYIPVGEAPENFTQKLIIQVENTDKPFDEIIREMQKELEAKTKNKFSVIEEMNGNTWIFEFKINNQVKKYSELNILKISTVTTDNGDVKPSYITYKIRGYADDIPTFNAHLKENTAKYVEEIRKFNL